MLRQVPVLAGFLLKTCCGEKAVLKAKIEIIRASVCGVLPALAVLWWPVGAHLILHALLFPFLSQAQPCYTVTVSAIKSESTVALTFAFRYREIEPWWMCTHKSWGTDLKVRAGQAGLWVGVDLRGNIVGGDINLLLIILKVKLMPVYGLDPPHPHPPLRRNVLVGLFPVGNSVFFSRISHPWSMKSVVSGKWF